MPRKVMNDKQRAAITNLKNAAKAQSSDAWREELYTLNNYIQDAPENDEIADVMTECIKEEIFPTDKDGNLDYDGIENFFTNLGRHSVKLESEYLKGLAEDPQSLKGPEHGKSQRPKEFMATAKSFLEGDEVISKFNEGVDDFNSKLKRNEKYKSRVKITPEQLQTWFDSGRKYALGRSRTTKEIINNSEKIQKVCQDKIGISTEDLAKEQKSAYDKFVQDEKKLEAEKLDGLLKADLKVEAEPEDIKVENKPEEIKVENDQNEIKVENKPEEIKIEAGPEIKNAEEIIDVNKANNINIINEDDKDEKENEKEDVKEEVYVNAGEDDLIFDFNGNQKNLNSVLNKGKIIKERTKTESALKNITDLQDDFNQNKLPEDIHIEFAKDCNTRIQELEHDLRMSKKFAGINNPKTHVDSTDFFEPMMSASADLRGAIVNKKMTVEEKEQCFDNLINKCDRYINKRSWGIFNIFKSTEGNQRIAYARDLKAYAKQLKKQYFNKMKISELNHELNEFGKKDFSKMTHNEVSDTFREFNALEARALNANGGVIPKETSQRMIDLRGAEEEFDAYKVDYMLKSNKNLTGIYKDDVANRAHDLQTENKTLGIIIQEEKGVKKTDAMHVLDNINKKNGAHKKHEKKKHSDVVKNMNGNQIQQEPLKHNNLINNNH